MTLQLPTKLTRGIIQQRYIEVPDAVIASFACTQSAFLNRFVAGDLAGGTSWIYTIKDFPASSINNQALGPYPNRWAIAPWTGKPGKIRLETAFELQVDLAAPAEYASAYDFLMQDEAFSNGLFAFHNYESHPGAYFPVTINANYILPWNLHMVVIKREEKSMMLYPAIHETYPVYLLTGNGPYHTTHVVGKNILPMPLPSNMSAKCFALYSSYANSYMLAFLNPLSRDEFYPIIAEYLEQFPQLTDDLSGWTDQPSSYSWEGRYKEIPHPLSERINTLSDEVLDQRHGITMKEAYCLRAMKHSFEVSYQDMVDFRDLLMEKSPEDERISHLDSAIREASDQLSALRTTSVARQVSETLTHAPTFPKPPEDVIYFEGFEENHDDERVEQDANGYWMTAIVTEEGEI